MNIFIDHFGDGLKHYRMAITSILYNECLRRRCVTKKGNVAQVEFYNNRYRAPVKWIEIVTRYLRFSTHKFELLQT